MKAISTTSIVVCIFVTCWIPYCCLQTSIFFLSKYSGITSMAWLLVIQKTDECFYVLLLLNGVIDPLIYAVRMRHIRKGEIHLRAIIN